VQSIIANSQGEYRVQLPAGTYDLIASSVNARETPVYGVTVTAGETVTVDIVMPTFVQELDAIVVTSSRGIEERETETVGTSHAISSLEIEERPAPTLTDHISRAPGVDVIRQGLQSTNVVVRGFNNIFSGALHMLTDHRLAGVPSLRVNLMHFVPANEQDVDRMEVVLGPGSALYGPNTANGVVHVLTKSPLDSEGTTVTLGGGERSLFQGSFRSAWALNEQFGFKVSGQYLRGDEWRYTDPTEQTARDAADADPTGCVSGIVVRGFTTEEAQVACSRVGRRDFDIERWGGEARADWRFADDGSVVATYGRTNATGIELTGLGAGQVEDWVYEFYQLRANKGRFFAQGYLNTSNAGDSFLLQSGIPLVDESRLWVGQIQHGVGLFDDRLDLTYGFDYFGTRPDSRGTVYGLYEDDDSIDEWGTYLQAKTAVTEQLDLVLAGRVDDHSILPDKVWSPRAGLVFRANDSQTFRLSYNRAFSTPTALNYYLDISGGLAPSIGALGYTQRAFGTGPGGWTLQPGGTIQIRSPFIGAGTVLTPPPDAAALWPAVIGVLQAQGAIDAPTAAFLAGNAPSSADVGYSLFDPQTSAIQPLAGATLPDVPAIQESYTETIELGWSGIVGGRAQISADVYYMKKNDFVSPLLVQTPLLTYTAGDLVAYLTPLVGAASALALAGGMAQVPLGVVSGETADVGARGADLIATYRNVGDVDMWGGDIAVQWFVTDDWTVSGAYSHVSKDFFSIPVLDGLDTTAIALNAPSHKGNVGLAYRNLDWGFNGGATMRFHDEFPAESAGFVGTLCVEGAPVGLTSGDCVESSVLVDLNLGYRVPGTDATLLFTVTNLFDSPYRSFVGVPEIGRLAMLSVRYDLF
jgi:iron complex outermembrane receptor protein